LCSTTPSPPQSVNLLRALSVRSADDAAKRPHAFEVATADETFFFAAESAAQRDEWVGALGRAIVMGSRATRRLTNSFSSDDGSDAAE